MQFMTEAKLLTVVGLIFKHTDCRITFKLLPIRLLCIITFMNSIILLNLFTKTGIYQLISERKTVIKIKAD